MHTYMSLHRVCVSSREFLFGVCLGYFCLEGFVRGGACPSPFCQNTFHYNRKLIITFNFRFHMYEIFLKCAVTCSWTPPPVTNCHTFSDPFPLERDVLYGRPPIDRMGLYPWAETWRPIWGGPKKNFAAQFQEKFPFSG